MTNKPVYLLAVLAFSVILSACGTAVAQDVNQPVRTLAVTGSSKISLAPDIAYISIGVQTQDSDAAAAVSTNNAQTRQVIDQLKRMGVEDKDIQTNNFSIYPQQDYDRDGQPRGITYFVNNTVSVTLRDLSRVGEILNGTVSAGANNIHGIQFDVADKSAPVNEARKSAIANAQATAREMAQAAGVNLGPIQSISFSGSYPPPIVYGREVKAAAMDMDVPISTGETSLTVEAYVVFEIR